MRKHVWHKDGVTGHTSCARCYMRKTWPGASDPCAGYITPGEKAEKYERAKAYAAARRARVLEELRSAELPDAKGGHE